MLRADEDSRMLFLFNELLLYISQCKWNRETRQLVDKNFELCSISSQESLLQRKVKFNDEMMKRQDGCFKLLCSVLQIWKQWKKFIKKPSTSENVGESIQQRIFEKSYTGSDIISA